MRWRMGSGRIWTHLEFENDSIRIKDLRRFRSYESVTSYNYGVDVTTCVVCSSDTKQLRSILKTGINTYRVKVLRMKGKNAEKILRDLEHEQGHRRLDRSDLLQILLTPLMGGQMSRQERIIRGYQLLKGERNHIEQEEMACMEAVLYIFAMKFLKRPQLEEIKEMMNMTILGEMIMKDGIEQGRREGLKEGRKEGRKEGKARVNRLFLTLIRMNRLDDLERAAEDSDYQEKLMAELFPQEGEENS